MGHLLYQRVPTLGGKRVCVFSPLQADVFSVDNRLARTMLMKKTHPHTHTHTQAHETRMRFTGVPAQNPHGSAQKTAHHVAHRNKPSTLPAISGRSHVTPIYSPAPLQPSLYFLHPQSWHPSLVPPWVSPAEMHVLGECESSFVRHPSAAELREANIACWGGRSM